MHKIKMIMCQLRASSCTVRMVWVPSHDKVRESFVVPDGYDEHTLRALNRAADELATVHLEDAMEASGRGEWHTREIAAVAWAKSTLDMAAEIGSMFNQAAT